MPRATSLLFTALLACGGQTAAPPPPAPPAPPPPPPAPKYVGLFGALPEVPAPADAAAAARTQLGAMLYNDTRLSKNQDISCNSCHRLDTFGVDNQARSPGHKGQLGGRNSPSTFNAALHFVQFWDGRAKDVEAQAKGPATNPVEMAMTDAAVDAVLTSIPGYEPLFAAAFPGDPKAVSFDNAAVAIGAFERTLVSPGAFDAYMKGDAAAISPEAVAGLEAFVGAGCATCHLGPTVGGTMYQKLGLVEPYPSEDTGRMQVTANEADRGFFKVPSLRNVARTGPYFHDGSIATLDEAITLMAKHQLGKSLAPAEVASIKVFLESLDGVVPADRLAKPELPPSGPKTPKPDPS